MLSGYGKQKPVLRLKPPVKVNTEYLNLTFRLKTTQKAQGT